MVKKLTKEHKEFMRQRAGWEFGLRLIQFMENFKSKEEPTIELTNLEKTTILSSIVTKRLERFKK